MNYKKFLAVLIAVVFIVLAGCSSQGGNDDNTTEPSAITTDNAVLKDADAINLIKSYSPEELGLEGSLDDYKIMVASSGVQIENNYYVKVIAGKITENEENNTVSIDEVGQYFISYDAAKILVYNKEDGTYSEMSDVHTLPESQSGSDTAVSPQ